jgi:hypothetical protein
VSGSEDINSPSMTCTHAELLDSDSSGIDKTSESSACEILDEKLLGTGKFTTDVL